jgi:predicted phosphate transport protein (TIGR00153 family)
MRFRLAPQDTRFYDMFTAAAVNIVEGVRLLSEFVTAPAERYEELSARMREAEHVGDDITHSVVELLDKSFVTPFDHDDIYRLAIRLDDVMDFVDQAVDFAVLYQCTDLPAEVVEQAALLVTAADLTAEAVPKLRTPKDLVRYWAEINQVENDADQVYRRALSRLFSGEYEPLMVLKLKEVVDSLEAAADAFEHAADVMHTIAIKES